MRARPPCSLCDGLIQPQPARTALASGRPRANHGPTLKLHTVLVPAEVASTVTAQLFRFATVLWSARKAKSAPAVCSAPPASVT